MSLSWTPDAGELVLIRCGLTRALAFVGPCAFERGNPAEAITAKEEIRREWKSELERRRIRLE